MALPAHIFDKVHSGILLTDLTGTVSYANAAAKKIFHGVKEGISIDEIFTFVLNSDGKPLSLRDSVLGETFKKGVALPNSSLKIGDSHSVKSVIINTEIEDSTIIFSFKLSYVTGTESPGALLIEKSPIAIHIYDRNGILLEANKAWENLWGVKREQGIGWYNVLKDKSIQAVGLEKHVRRAQAGKSGEFGDVSFKSDAYKEGNTRHVSTKYFPLFDESGEVDRIVVFNEDVTKRVEIQNRLTESEEQLTAVMQNLSGLTYMISHSPYEVIYMNQTVLKTCGYSEEQFMTGEVKWRKLIKQDDLVAIDKVWKDCVKSKRNYVVEYNVKHKDGHWVMVRDSGTGVFDSNSKLKYVVGYIEDITESRAIHERVRLNEIKFRSIFENAGHGIVISDASGIFLQANKRALQILGYKKAELENKIGTLDITHPDDLESTKVRLGKLGCGELKKAFIEKRCIKKNGQVIWTTFNTTTYKDPVTGDIVLVGIVDDISDSKKILQEISASELKFRSVFEETGHGIVILNEKLKIIDSNEKLRSILGLTKKTLREGISISSSLHPSFKSQFEKILLKLKADPSKKFQSEGLFKNKKGSSIWGRIDVSAYVDPHTEELRVVLILEDITRRKFALEELQRNEDFQKETIDSLSLGLMVMSTTGEISLINKVWEHIVGSMKTLKGAITGRNFLEIIEQMKDRTTLVDGIMAVVNDESSLFEFELTLDENGHNWFVMRGAKLQSQFDSIVITLQEVTVRKRVEQALEESLRSYRNIYNHTPVMMHSIDQSGKLVSVSNFWLEKLGYKRHEVIGKHLRDFLTEESKNDADIILPVFFQKGSIFDVSYHFVTKDGRVLETLLSAIEEGKGTNSARSLAVVTDITLLKRTERELKRNREDLLEAQSMAKIGNFELVPSSRTFTSSPVFDEILEIEDESQKTFDLMPLATPAGDLKEAVKMMEEIFRTGKPLEYTGQAVTLKTKKTIWLEILGRAEIENGRVVRLLGTIQDITKSKEYELEIQHLSERLTLAMDAANIGVWELNLVNRELHYEPPMYDLFQLEPPNKFYTWQDMLDAVHPDDLDKLNSMQDRLKASEEVIEQDFRLVLSRDTRHFRSVSRQFYGPNGLERILGVVTDITEDKLLLNKLEVSLHEKDILIKEVHHRVKNNMQMISSILALKALDLSDEDSRKVFDDCTMRVKSMAVVHDQLYRFYNVSEISISEYLNHLLGSLNALLVGGAGNYQINIEADDYLMDVDEALLCGLIVSEIVANAFKHGFVNIESGEVNVKFKIINDEKHLSVTNSGLPMPENILEMKTSSLGMSLIRTFANQLEGKLHVHQDNGLEVIF